MSRYLNNSIALITLLPLASSALAANFNVTRFDDPAPNACVINDCSLREAVIAANLLAGADSITLAQGSYELSQTAGLSDAERDDLDVSDTLSVIGVGSAQTLIRTSIPSAGLNRRIFELTGASLYLQQLGLRDGDTQVPGALGDGGCVRAVNARLSLSDVQISNCQSGFGGAISLQASTALFNSAQITSSTANYGGAIAARNTTLRGRDSVLSNNLANVGGALWIAPDGNALATRMEWMIGSRLDANRALYQGGGIAVVQGAKLIVAPTFTSAGIDDLLMLSANQAGGDGGGIYLDSSASLEASRLSLRKNISDSNGGGLFANGNITLSDSEFLDNSAALDGGGVAIRGLPSPSGIERTSFAFNLAGRYGGAISNSVDAFYLRNISSYKNAALSGGAVDIAANNTRILHFSSFDDSGGSAGSLRLAGNAWVQNSALSNACAGFGGAVIDLGGNAQVIGLPSNCAGTTFSAAQLALGYGYAGGRFNIVRILKPSSVLRDFAALSALVPNDVRGWQRIGAMVDTGAFEYGATP
jgi:CSLREA domain-containing protein